MAVVSIRVSKIGPPGALRIRTRMGVNSTALAARVAAVLIGSGWTNFVDRSSLDGVA